MQNIRLAGLIAIIGIPGLTRSNGSVINELEKMLSKASDDRELLTVLADGIELVIERSLQLLAGNVGELSLSDEGLGFGADKLLLEYNDPRRVGLLVLQLCDLICDLLLPVTAGLHRGLDVADALDGRAVLVVAVDILVLKLTNFIDQDAELVGDVRNIVVARLAPDGQLLLISVSALKPETRILDLQQLPCAPC